MTFEAFFGASPILIIATVFLIFFTFLGAFDGLYFHIYKFKLHRLPEAKLEHFVHAVRGILFVPIAVLLFAVNSGGWLLWTGLFLLFLDMVLEVVDILVEKSAREPIGGICPVESALHVTATAARIAGLALILSTKPASAWGLHSPIILGDYPPFLSYTGWLFAIGTGLGTLGQLWTMWVVHFLRSDHARGISNEGNPIEDYNIAKIHLSMPIALLMEMFLRMIRPTIRERVVGELPPKNAILYTYHRDALLSLSSKALISLPRPAYVGYHGIASYFPTLHYALIGIRALRFKKDIEESPKSQVIRMIKAWDGMVLMRTDSGKPYGKVRASLLDLAAATGRPLVPVVQKADRFLTLFEHAIPLRSAQITTYFGGAIPAEALAGLDREQARELLQNNIDVLLRMKKENQRVADLKPRTTA